MKKIKNENYKQFLEQGIITLLTQDQINQALKNIPKKHNKEAQTLLLILYYTGCRPNEALKLISKDIKKQNQYIIINMPASKGGLPRPIYLRYKNPHIKIIYEYAQSIFPEMYLFSHFKNQYKRTHKNKKGEIKERIETTNKIYYHVKKWFQGILPDSIPPYFLRHNRFSQLAEAGADLREIQQIKGSRSIESVSYYVHLSAKTAKEIAKKIK